MATSVKPWTDDQCLQLEPLFVLCQARRDAHQSAFNFFNRWNNVVSLPSILVGSVLSTLSFNDEAAPAGVSAGLAIFMTVMFFLIYQRRQKDIEQPVVDSTCF